MTGGFAHGLSDGEAGFPALLEAAEAYLEERDVPPDTATRIMIALDEIVSNVLRHGGGTGDCPFVEIMLNATPDRFTGEIIDDGTPFDPLSTPPPDTSLPLENRPIGGLGIHLVRELMDEVSYMREAGKNRLRFSKVYSIG